MRDSQARWVQRGLIDKSHIGPNKLQRVSTKLNSETGLTVTWQSMWQVNMMVVMVEAVAAEVAAVIAVVMV